MAKRIEPIFYWDSCVFIALLSEEQRSNNEMQGVLEVAEANKRKENTIITSAITRTEIFKDNKVNDDYKKVLQRSNVIEISADPKITDLASIITKDIYELYKTEKRQISMPDSIHIATAIIYGVKAFHTFDEKDRPSGKKNISLIGLLPLSGSNAVRGLRIEKPPRALQYKIDFKERKIDN